jgi:hypothetical protein
MEESYYAYGCYDRPTIIEFHSNLGKCSGENLLFFQLLLFKKSFISSTFNLVVSAFVYAFVFWSNKLKKKLTHSETPF